MRESQAGPGRPRAQRALGDHVRIAEQLADNQLAAGSEDAGQLPESGVLVGNLAQHRDQVRGIHAGVRIRKLPRVTAASLDVLEAGLSRLPHRVIEHLLLEVEDVQRSFRAEPVGHVHV